MTLNEAIKYCEDMAALSHKGSGNVECEQNHRQLAEWLRDYKRFLEQEPCDDAISRQAVEDIRAEIEALAEKEVLNMRIVLDIIDKHLKEGSDKE